MPHIYVFTVRVPKHLSVARREYFFVPTQRHLQGRHWRIEANSPLLDLTKFGSEASSAARRPTDDETAPQFAPDSLPSKEGVATEQFPNQIAMPYRDFQRRDPTKPLDVVVLFTSYARGDGCFHAGANSRQLALWMRPQGNWMQSQVGPQRA